MNNLKATQVTAPASAPARMKSVTMSYQSMGTTGALWVEFMRMRKRIFIDELKWDLPTAEDFEFDQYDTPFCRYIATHAEGEILGGVRLIPTTAVVGGHSYMLRDAQLGLLPDLPSNILDEKAPVSPEYWEASRLFLREDISDEQRAKVRNQLYAQMFMTALAGGAKYLISTLPHRWPSSEKYGVIGKAAGPRIYGDLMTQAVIIDIPASIAAAQRIYQEKLQAQRG